MGRSIDATFVGAYIKLGSKTWNEIGIAFRNSEFSNEFNGEYYSYINEKIPYCNDDSYKEVICPSVDKANITSEITAGKIQAVKTFVETEYATEIIFLRTIFGTADVIVGVYKYETEEA